MILKKGGVLKGSVCVFVPGGDGPPTPQCLTLTVQGLAGSSGYLNEHVGS